jgi:hypothetical protein
MDMSAFIEFIVWSLSASFLKSRTSLKKEIKELNKPLALLEIEGSNFSFDVLSSEKLNLFSKI